MDDLHPQLSSLLFCLCFHGIWAIHCLLCNSVKLARGQSLLVRTTQEWDLFHVYLLCRYELAKNETDKKAEDADVEKMLDDIKSNEVDRVKNPQII